jgi:hypothetical protein
LPLQIPFQLLRYVPNFECSFDGAPFKDCVSPKTYDKLNTEVGHSFQVRSTGMLGNLDKHPANFTFTTITSADIEVIVKNNNTKQSNARFLIDYPPHFLINKTLDSQGGFLLEGIRQGNHNITVISNNDGNPYYDTFYVPAGQQELMKITFNIHNMTLTSIPTKKFNNTLSKSSDIVNKSVGSSMNMTKSEPYVPQSLNATNSEPNGSQSLNAINSELLLYNQLEYANDSAMTKDKSNINLLHTSMETNKTQNLFLTRISVNASDKTLSEINKVVYYLPVSFKPHVLTVYTKDNNFGISFTNYGSLDLNASIFLKKEIINYTLPLDK